jgi:hypothetical protein
LAYEETLQEDRKMGRVFLAAIVFWGLVFSSICFGYSGGSGTPEDPYQIATKADLLALAGTTTDYNKCFIMTADINMEGQVFTTAIIAADTSSDDYFQGTAFTGTFDGNSHKITNFTINGGSNYYLGLFGYIDAGGTVKNLGLENCAVSGWDYVGGLVGINHFGTVSICYASGSVSGGYWYVGGLVGWNNSTVSNCYATGSVSGSSIVGGLVGYNYFGTVTASFWDIETSGQSWSAGGTGKTTTEMMMESTFTSAGWDFVGETANGTDDIWRMCIDGVNYPLLWWQFNKADFTCPDGVNFIDFAVLANAWLSDSWQANWNWNPRCDIAEPPDNIIDILDLEIFAERWLQQN